MSFMHSQIRYLFTILHLSFVYIVLLILNAWVEDASLLNSNNNGFTPFLGCPGSSKVTKN